MAYTGAPFVFAGDGKLKSPGFPEPLRGVSAATKLDAVNGVLLVVTDHMTSVWATGIPSVDTSRLNFPESVSRVLLSVADGLMVPLGPKPLTLVHVELANVAFNCDDPAK